MEISDETTMDMFLSITAASSTLEKNLNKGPVDMLNEQLTSIFTEGGELAEKRKEKDFFWKYYVDYFYQLAKSGNMPAFTRLISLSAYHDENVKWLKENDAQLKALSNWELGVKREFWFITVLPALFLTFFVLYTLSKFYNIFIWF